jgi:predicted phosphodiesterase
MKRIVCISDTHGLHNSMTNYNKLGQGDILVHAGDFSNIGKKQEIVEFIAWLHRQLDSFNNIVFIAGNHDRGMDPMFVESKSSVGHVKLYDENDLYSENEITRGSASEKPEWLIDLISSMDKRVHYLENSGVSIDDLKFWGSPITPNFYEAHWAFNRTRGEKITKYWDMIPKDTNVLVTHGPMKGVMDLVDNRYQSEHVGCEDLEHTVNYELNDLKLFTFGHIHDGYGKRVDSKGRTFVNASTCTEQYVPKNAPIVVEI